VREESHLDDMRAAIRGDFERLAARRGGQDLMQEPAVEPEPPEEPVPEEQSAPPFEEAQELPREPADLVPRRSLLARMLGL
jgi:hypothetical protein